MSFPVTSVKITTVGNSLGIVLPREVLQRLRVEKGDQLYLVETRGGVELVAYEPEVLAQIEALERTARLERTVLRGLAGRDRGATGMVVRTAKESNSAAVLTGTVYRGAAKAAALPPDPVDSAQAVGKSSAPPLVNSATRTAGAPDGDADE